MFCFQSAVKFSKAFGLCDFFLLDCLDKHCGNGELVNSLDKYEDFESFEREDNIIISHGI